MKIYWSTKARITTGFLVSCSASWLATGCGQQGKAPEPLPMAEIPKAMESAFLKSDGPSRDIVSNVVVSIRANDSAKALFLTETLAQRPNLNVGQHTIISRSLMTLVEEAQAAAAKGDQSTVELMQMRRAMK